MIRIENALISAANQANLTSLDWVIVAVCLLVPVNIAVDGRPDAGIPLVM